MLQSFSLGFGFYHMGLGLGLGHVANGLRFRPCFDGDFAAFAGNGSGEEEFDV